jgi:hypothetical protein
MARNRLFRSVQEKSWSRREEWGPLSEHLRPDITSSVDALLLESSIPKDIISKVAPQVSWDIMLICFENEYADLVQPFFYIPLLEPWYASGHFPCGWQGNEFPDRWDGTIGAGKLIVF